MRQVRHVTLSGRWSAHRWEGDVSHVARNCVEKRWTGSPKLKMIVPGRQKELIGPPQRGIVVDMMSYAYGNHWGAVGEPEIVLSWNFYRVTKLRSVQ